MYWLSFLTVLASAAPTDPSTAQTLLDEGRTLLKDRKIDEAVEALSRCTSLNPELVECSWELGWAYWLEKDWDKVLTSWETVEKIQPDFPGLSRWLGAARDHAATERWLSASAENAPASVRPPLPTDFSLDIRAVGDIMMGTTFPHPTSHLPPEDGATMLAAVKPWLTGGDVTFGNLEGPLCDSGETKKCKDSTNCYAFRSPTRYVRYLTDAGFDLLSTANNHSGDFGRACLQTTEETLVDAGIAFSGRPGTVASVEVKGIRLGMIGFHTSPACNNVNEIETAAALVSAVKAQHDLVIVSFHGGAEGSKALHTPNGPETFYGEKRGHLRAFSRAVIGAGADLVLGHGPHVPRGFELIDGHLVAYSLGNFATYDRFNLSGHLSTSLVLQATLDSEGRLVAGQIHPVVLEGRGIPAPDAEGTAIDLIRSLTASDFPSTSLTIAKDGSFAPTASVGVARP